MCAMSLLDDATDDYPVLALSSNAISISPLTRIAVTSK
jgi:hypothetical protein